MLAPHSALDAALLRVVGDPRHRLQTTLTPSAARVRRPEGFTLPTHSTDDARAGFQNTVGNETPRTTYPVPQFGMPSANSSRTGSGQSCPIAHSVQRLIAASSPDLSLLTVDLWR
jgi:hypothetical protein